MHEARLGVAQGEADSALPDYQPMNNDLPTTFNIVASDTARLTPTSNRGFNCQTGYPQRVRLGEFASGMIAAGEL
jgi:hypothetical protein